MSFISGQTTVPEIVRKQSMEMSLQQNLNIVSLSYNLKEVFRSLTN